MLKKSAIVVLYAQEDQFLSSLFLLNRKDGGGEEGWGGGNHPLPQKECNSSFVSRTGPISQLVVSSEKERSGRGGGRGKSPITQKT